MKSNKKSLNKHLKDSYEDFRIKIRKFNKIYYK